MIRCGPWWAWWVGRQPRCGGDPNRIQTGAPVTWRGLRRVRALDARCLRPYCLGHRGSPWANPKLVPAITCGVVVSGTDSIRGIPPRLLVVDVRRGGVLISNFMQQQLEKVVMPRVGFRTHDERRQGPQRPQDEEEDASEA